MQVRKRGRRLVPAVLLLGLVVKASFAAGPMTVNDAEKLLVVSFCWVATTVCDPGLLLGGTVKVEGEHPEILPLLPVEQVATSVPLVVLMVPSQ